MKSRLLGPKGILELLALPDLGARLDFLKKTEYGEAVAAHLSREPHPLRGAERGLRARLLQDLARIDRFLGGERAQPLYRALLGFEDGWNLKTILRGMARGEPPDRIFLLLAPTPALDDAALGELMRQREAKAVVDLLATWQSPYALPLQEALPEYLRRGELLTLEVALDRWLFARALAVARSDGEDGRVALGFLEAQIDLTNTGTLLKLAGEGGAGEFFVPGGRLIGEPAFRRYARLAREELRESLARAGQRHRAPGIVQMAKLSDPFGVDQVLHQALRDSVRREARINPHSLAVPLAFVLERQAEVRRIRLVLRGAEFGVPHDRLLDLLER
jgi:V/A-type H+-transporting ATPase subunit C